MDGFRMARGTLSTGTAFGTCIVAAGVSPLCGPDRVATGTVAAGIVAAGVSPLPFRAVTGADGRIVGSAVIVVLNNFMAPEAGTLNTISAPSSTKLVVPEGCVITEGLMPPQAVPEVPVGATGT